MANNNIIRIPESRILTPTGEFDSRLNGRITAQFMDPLDERLAKFGTELIAPHRGNRKKAKTQDGRKLKRYKRRWKVERLFSWLHNFRPGCGLL